VSPKASADELPADLKHILGSDHAHREGHYWHRHGEPDLAHLYLEIGSRHGSAAADEDLAELAKSHRTADCPEADPPAVAAASLRERLGVRLAPVMATAVTVVAVAAAGFAVGQNTGSAVAVQESWVPTEITAGMTEPKLRLSLTESPPPASTAPEVRPSSEPGEPSSPAPAPGQENQTAAQFDPDPATPVDPHIAVTRTDVVGESFTALAALGDSGEWRRLRFPTVPETVFRATLWSAGRQPCSWRFAGLDGTGPDADETTTAEVRVPAGERSETAVNVNGWPVLAAEVRGGGRSSASCLLANWAFVPAESATVSPDARERPVSRDQDRPVSPEQDRPVSPEQEPEQHQEQGPDDATPTPEPSVTATGEPGVAPEPAPSRPATPSPTPSPSAEEPAVAGPDIPSHDQETTR
jgi:hypothetical protein